MIRTTLGTCFIHNGLHLLRTASIHHMKRHVWNILRLFVIFINRGLGKVASKHGKPMSCEVDGVPSIAATKLDNGPITLGFDGG